MEGCYPDITGLSLSWTHTRAIDTGTSLGPSTVRKVSTRSNAFLAYCRRGCGFLQCDNHWGIKWEGRKESWITKSNRANLIIMHCIYVWNFQNFLKITWKDKWKPSSEVQGYRDMHNTCIQCSNKHDWRTNKYIHLTRRRKIKGKSLNITGTYVLSEISKKLGKITAIVTDKGSWIRECRPETRGEA